MAVILPGNPGRDHVSATVSLVNPPAGFDTVDGSWLDTCAQVQWMDSTTRKR